MSEIDFWEALAEGGNPIAKRNLEEFTNDERRTKHNARRTTNDAQCTTHNARCTMHNARCTLNTEH